MKNKIIKLYEKNYKDFDKKKQYAFTCYRYLDSLQNFRSDDYDNILYEKFVKYYNDYLNDLLDQHNARLYTSSYDAPRMSGIFFNTDGYSNSKFNLHTSLCYADSYYAQSNKDDTGFDLTMTPSEKNNLINADFEEFEKTFVKKLENQSNRIDLKLKKKSLKDSNQKLFGNTIDSTFKIFMDENFGEWEFTDYTGKKLEVDKIYSNKPNFLVNSTSKKPYIKLNNSIRITKVDSRNVVAEFRIKSFKLEQKKIDLVEFKKDLIEKLENIKLYLK